VRAGSQRAYTDFNHTAKLIIKGTMFAESNMKRVGVSGTLPMAFLALPDRMFGLDETLYWNDAAELASSSIHNLTDCQMATFNHSAIRKLVDSNREFAGAIKNALFLTLEDSMAFSALLRANYVQDSVRGLLSLLEPYDIHLTQEQIALVLGHDRASVARALPKIKTSSPQLWRKYRAKLARA
jgi:CRP-like cAMP-binding protein